MTKPGLVKGRVAMSLAGGGKGRVAPCKTAPPIIPLPCPGGGVCIDDLLSSTGIIEVSGPFEDSGCFGNGGPEGCQPNGSHCAEAGCLVEDWLSPNAFWPQHQWVWKSPNGVWVGAVVYQDQNDMLYKISGAIKLCSLAPGSVFRDLLGSPPKTLGSSLVDCLNIPQTTLSPMYAAVTSPLYCTWPDPTSSITMSFRTEACSVSASSRLAKPCCGYDYSSDPDINP